MKLARVRPPYLDPRLLNSDLSDFTTPSPEFERLATYREKSQACIALVTYLEAIGCVIQPPKGMTFHLRSVLCEFFGVNESALQQEKLKLVGGLCHEKRKSIISPRHS